MVEANIVVMTVEGFIRKLTEYGVIKSIPLMKGMNRDTAKHSCDMMQQEYDRECKPVRVYLFVGNDPCPTYAGLAGACK